MANPEGSESPTGPKLTTGFIEAPLGSDGKTFKLLRILPSNERDSESLATSIDIECDLLVADLSDAPRYEALSYTWGSTIQDQPIKIHFGPNVPPNQSAVFKTEEILVTKHLHSAIRRLRQPTHSRTVWVDQLCINQTNIQERNAQVRLMAEVYRKAERTVVWLGEADILDIDQDAIVDATERMNFRPIDHPYSTPEDQVILKELIGFRSQGTERQVGLRRRQVLAEVLNRPWFTRAWVFQEVVVAKSGIVLCGSLEMDMEIFINLLDGVCDLDLQEMGEAASIMHASRGYKPMFAIREARFEERYGLSSSRKSKWLATLWQGMGNLSATNPRDKVYAFLAFSDSEEAARIAPSYQLSVDQVYCDAAYRSIRSIKSLDVLELAIKSREVATHHITSSRGIPSWVPDFAAPLPSLPFMTHNVGSTDFNAARKSPYPYPLTAITNDSTTLPVRGHVISKIKSIAPFDFTIDRRSATLHNRFRLPDVMAWLHSQIESTTLAKLSTIELETRVLRTLFAQGAGRDDTPANMNFESARIREVYHQEPSLLQHKASGLFGEPARSTDPQSVRDLKTSYRYYKWMTTVAAIADSKSFFLTEHHDLGIAYEAIEEGDSVCILLGSKTPGILREAPSSESGSNTYVFVAQCYLDGWMHGEEHQGREWTPESAKSFELV
ncbi:MAG: hypothetical protein Q9183_004327 [Haloplaca sp. 2 TL-2023]